MSLRYRGPGSFAHNPYHSAIVQRSTALKQRVPFARPKQYYTVNKVPPDNPAKPRNVPFEDAYKGNWEGEWTPRELLTTKELRGFQIGSFRVKQNKNRVLDDTWCMHDQQYTPNVLSRVFTKKGKSRMASVCAICGQQKSDFVSSTANNPRSNRPPDRWFTGGDIIHPGFASVASSIAGRNNPRTGKPYGLATAKAILASSSRRASPKAKRRNPRLLRVRARRVKGK